MLGDRPLRLRRPNLRGDDVAELQRRLGRLGFDPGRVDGILGPDTANALTEFQRNVELTPDGICGPQTVRALERLQGRAATGPAVTVVREVERLSHGQPTLQDRRVVVGHLGGLGSLPRTVGRALQARGSSVLDLDDPDGAHQAAAANRFQRRRLPGPGHGHRRQHRVLRHGRLRVRRRPLPGRPAPRGAGAAALPSRRTPAGDAAARPAGDDDACGARRPPAGPTRVRPQPRRGRRHRPRAWPAGWSLRSPSRRLRVCPQGCTQVCMTLNLSVIRTGVRHPRS